MKLEVASVNAFTIDVEDYFQVSAFEGVINPEQWSGFESRVERNTQRILQLLDDASIRGTFFTLGWVAERMPGIVRDIAKAGHEVACHGYSHRLIFEQKQAEFIDETYRSKAMLEDQAQQPILAYRAASYSITNKSLWALDVLAKAGFELDSSIFPIRHDRYGIPDAPRYIHRVALANGASLIEYPLSSLHWLGVNVPVAGGGYFRLYPYTLTRFLLRRLLSRTGEPFVFYLHPWEVDPAQPRIANAPLLSKFRHYLNLERCEPRLVALMRDFRFGTLSEAVAAVQAQCAGQLPTHTYH